MYNRFIAQILVKLRNLYRRISAILYNRRAEIELPDHVLSDLARCFTADIKAFFTVSENQAAYEKWLHEREQQATKTQNEKV